MRSWGLVSLGLAFVLAGCGLGGNQVTGLPTFEVPELDADREQFLATFPLLNDSSENLLRSIPVPAVRHSAL